MAPDQHELSCNAPFNNIYFNTLGQGSACWLTFQGAPRYPEHSIREIWFGPYFEELRKLIRKRDLSAQCSICEKNIRDGGRGSALASAYDLEGAGGKYPAVGYPAIMEFEFSNACNLECIMCNGRLSSAIRKNREHLPPAPVPYDEAFIDQLEEFIPHLREARFNGGEPFLQKLCWLAWERILKINKKVEITIATNGTIWNTRIVELLARGRFRINISLDGMTKATYERIRQRADFKTVMTNIQCFAEYCREKGTILSIMINPMRVNWRELPLFVDFCNLHGLHLSFNTVYKPHDLALWTLPSSELFDIHALLTRRRFGRPAHLEAGSFESNVAKYRALVDGRILNWAREQEALRK